MDSTFENVNQCKEILRDILENDLKDFLIIGIANYQEKSHRLTPDFCERILAKVCEPPIHVYGISSSYPVYREKILSILREAVNIVLKGQKPRYKLKPKIHTHQDNKYDKDKEDSREGGGNL
jgi:hypothetical protein